VRVCETSAESSPQPVHGRCGDRPIVPALTALLEATLRWLRRSARRGQTTLIQVERGSGSFDSPVYGSARRCSPEVANKDGRPDIFGRPHHLPDVSGIPPILRSHRHHDEMLINHCRNSRSRCFFPAFRSDVLRFAMLPCGLPSVRIRLEEGPDSLARERLLSEPRDHVHVRMEQFLPTDAPAIPANVVPVR
jgi:hypothetical protein